MNNNQGNKDYLSSTEAAKLIGVSVTTVQKLVDQQSLLSWRTEGGHRRILLRSLKEYVEGKRIPLDVDVLHKNPVKLMAIASQDETFVAVREAVRGIEEEVLTHEFKKILDATLSMHVIEPHLVIVESVLFSNSELDAWARHILASQNMQQTYILVISPSGAPRFVGHMRMHWIDNSAEAYSSMLRSYIGEVAINAQKALQPSTR